jgi:predicted ester cyclase
MTGTHRGLLGPFPVSGRSVRLTGISITQLIDGKIICDRVRADMVGLLAQIGAVPAVPN